MRGRGRTAAPAAGYSLDDGCDDLLAMLDHLGFARVALGGHSFGGLKALSFAARYPQRVESLVLLDAAHAMHPATFSVVSLALLRADLPHPTTLHPGGMFRSSNPAGHRRMADDPFLSLDKSESAGARKPSGPAPTLRGGHCPEGDSP